MADTRLPTAQFETEAVLAMLRLLQEATRATPSGGRETYVPPTGGEIAEANYHHFVFGQRGSGKSSLLRHLQHRTAVESRASVWIDQEIFSNLSYPDVLVSAVHEVMKGARAAVQEHFSAPRHRWYHRVPFVSKPRSADQQLISELTRVVFELEKLRYAPLDRKVEWVVVNEDQDVSGASAGVRMELVSLEQRSDTTVRASRTATETVEGTKEQYLERALTEFRDLLSRASVRADGGFIFVDDLYQLKRSDQPLVVGYLHRLVKDTGLWLKIGSIRYSTVTFKPGDPPRGMEVGHDAHEVALDRGLRHIKSTQTFLEKILARIAEQAAVDIKELLTDDARKRLVLAAGGVARDYLRLVSGAINEARNRGVTTKAGSHRVIVEDVNQAAGLLAPTKLDDLRKDEPGEAVILERLVRRLTEFCRTRRSAFFLIPTDDADLNKQIDKLQNLRFTHLLFESETVPDKSSQRFDVWLLDVAELSAQRATTGMDFLNWEKREKRRNRNLIFTDADAAR